MGEQETCIQLAFQREHFGTRMVLEIMDLKEVRLISETIKD